MAEVLLRHALLPFGTAALPRTPPGDLTATVGSAGLLTEDQPASDGAVRVMAERAIDLSGHLSRRMIVPMLRHADLVLGMTREHVREAVVLDPSAWEKTFTLKELVRRAAVTGPRPDGEVIDEWLRRVGRGRVMADLMGEDASDDVADPIGRSLSVYRATADELDHLIQQLVAAAWGSVPRQRDQRGGRRARSDQGAA
jgi:protein-tyrosine phosphatase